MAKRRNTPEPGLRTRERADRLPEADRRPVRADRGDERRTRPGRQLGPSRLNRQVGHRLRVDVLGAKRVGYGERIIHTVAEGLTADDGRGFLRHMIRFVERFPDREVVSALSRQLGWTHFRALIYIDDLPRREFHAEMCRVERWSKRVLEKKIDGMLFERTALSRKPEELARREHVALRDEDLVTPDLVFRDPYLPASLGFEDVYGERDLEAFILGLDNGLRRSTRRSVKRLISIRGSHAGQEGAWSAWQRPRETSVSGGIG